MHPAGEKSYARSAIGLSARVDVTLSTHIARRARPRAALPPRRALCRASLRSDPARAASGGTARRSDRSGPCTSPAESARTRDRGPPSACPSHQPLRTRTACATGAAAGAGAGARRRSLKSPSRSCARRRRARPRSEPRRASRGRAAGCSRRVRLVRRPDGTGDSAGSPIRGLLRRSVCQTTDLTWIV